MLKHTIYEYMKRYCYGFRNAQPHQDIANALGINERTFRKVCETLKTEGNIASNSADGYWFIPPVVINDPEEIEALKHSVSDKFARGYAMLDQARKMAARLEAKVNSQATFA